MMFNKELVTEMRAIAFFLGGIWVMTLAHSCHFKDIGEQLRIMNERSVCAVAE